MELIVTVPLYFSSCRVSTARKLVCNVAVQALEPYYALLRIVSIDVALAALGGGVLAVRVIGSHPPNCFYGLLPAGVWVAYSVDHLLDARRIGPEAHTARHRFHYYHARGLLTAVVLVSTACAVAGWIGLSWFGLFYAGIMCGLVILHETIIKLAGARVSPLLLKEFGVALVFTAGVWGMPLLRHWLDTGTLSGWPIFLMVQYFIFALINLMEFAIYEARSDRADGQTSFVQAIGRRSAVRLVYLLLFISVLGITFSIFNYPNVIFREVEAIYCCMTAGLWLVVSQPRLSLKNERYRTLGDGVFLLPLFLLFINF